MKAPTFEDRDREAAEGDRLYDEQIQRELDEAEAEKMRKPCVNVQALALLQVMAPFDLRAPMDRVCPVCGAKNCMKVSCL